LLYQAWQPLGALDKVAVRDRVSLLRRFFVFLDATTEPLAIIEAMTPELIDRYESWLEQRGIGRIYQRHLLSALITPLRLLAEQEPDRLAPETVDRLAFLGHGPCGRSQPNDAYSGAIAAALRRAGHTQVLAAAARVAPADTRPQFAGYDHPDLKAHLNVVIDAIEQHGAIARAAHAITVSRLLAGTADLSNPTAMPRSMADSTSRFWMWSHL